MSVDDFFTADTGSATTGAASLVLTVPRSVAAGKKLVLAHGRADVTGSTVVGLSSVTDSKGNTWTVNDAISIRANQGGVTFAHCDVTTALAAGDTITVTQSAAAARKFVDVWVCSGLAAGGPSATTGATATANTNSNANGASTTPTGSLTTTAVNSVVFGAAYFGGSGVPAVAGSGYTLDSTRATTDSAPKGWASEHGTVATTGAKSVVLSQASSSAWALAAVAFSPVANAAPVANAGPPQVNVQPNSTVYLDGTGSYDPDGPSVSFAWTQTGGVSVALTGATTSSPSYVAPGTLAGDTQTFQLTVTDNLGATSTATVTVQVRLAPEQIMTAGGWAPGKLALITADPNPPPGSGITLSITVESNYSPPRIRIDVTDTSATPVSQVTITRRGADGRTYPVRTTDGGPLALSGGVGTVWDYEAPFGQVLTYSTGLGPTAATRLDVARPWLVHPGVPSRSITFRHGQGSHASESWDIVQGSFTVLGRSTPIVTTGGARVSAASTLVILCTDPSELSNLALLLSDGSPLFLNTPPSLSWGVDPCYIAVGRAQVDRVIPVLTEDFRSVTLPYQVVARPGGGTQAAITWNTIDADYSDWTSVEAAGLTWAELAAPTAA